VRPDVGLLQRDYTALHLRRLPPSYSPPLEPEILHILGLFLRLFIIIINNFVISVQLVSVKQSVFSEADL
jgi:hypothetical protein